MQSRGKDYGDGEGEQAVLMGDVTGGGRCCRFGEGTLFPAGLACDVGGVHNTTNRPV
jgi:hypothetical protein